MGVDDTVDLGKVLVASKVHPALPAHFSAFPFKDLEILVKDQNLFLAQSPALFATQIARGDIGSIADTTADVATRAVGQAARIHEVGNFDHGRPWVIRCRHETPLL